MAYGKDDIRLARRGEDLLDAIVAKSSLVLRKVGAGRAGEVAAGRFLDNDEITFEAIIATAAARSGRHRWQGWGTDWRGVDPGRACLTRLPRTPARSGHGARVAGDRGAQSR